LVNKSSGSDGHHGLGYLAAREEEMIHEVNVQLVIVDVERGRLCAVVTIRLRRGEGRGCHLVEHWGVYTYGELLWAVRHDHLS